MTRDFWNDAAATFNIFFNRKQNSGSAEPQAALFPLVGAAAGGICTLTGLVAGILFGREAAGLFAAIVLPLGCELMTEWRGLRSLSVYLTLRFRRGEMAEAVSRDLEFRREMTPIFLFVSLYLLRALAFGMISFRSPSIFLPVFTGAYLVRSGLADCAAEDFEPLLGIPEEKKRIPYGIAGAVVLLTGILSLHLQVLAGGFVLLLAAELILRIQRHAVIRHAGRPSPRLFEIDGYLAETLLLLAGIAVA